MTTTLENSDVSSNHVSPSSYASTTNHVQDADVDDSVMIVEPNNSNIANHTVSNSKQNNIASAAAPVVENNINNVVSRDDTTTVSDRAKHKLNDVKKGIAAREFNKQLRVSIVKEVRKPGKSKLIPDVAGDACTYEYCSSCLDMPYYSKLVEYLEMR